MSKQSQVNAKMRAILIDWLILVHVRFTLLQETLYLTISIIDRYLQVRVYIIDRYVFRLFSSGHLGCEFFRPIYEINTYCAHIHCGSLANFQHTLARITN